jgi:hypothetical protein
LRAKEGLIALLLAGHDLSGPVKELLSEAPVRDTYDDILMGLLEMQAGQEAFSRGKLLARLGEEGLQIVERVWMDDPVPKHVDKALKDYCQIIRQGYLLHELKQTPGGKDDIIVSLDELRGEEERARKRILLGLGEGFRLPPNIRNQPPAR